MPAELKYGIVTLLLTILSFWLPGGRVMTLPFFFTFILVLIFWSARRSAEREEQEEA
jgi:hypothetical protein